jgi:cobalt-zinc-cadmium efflux system protein
VSATRVPRTLLANLLLFVLRLGLAAVFIAAAMPKIMAPDLFAGAIFNYQVLPAWGVNALALVLPWLELLVGVCLALGLWSRASALMVAGMMLVFIGAFSLAKARGLDISCGCFEVGKVEQPTSIVWVLVRDCSLCAAALLLARYDGSPGLLGLGRRLWRGSAVAAS